jgi:type II secretory pathway pseudopilin PulG
MITQLPDSRPCPGAVVPICKPAGPSAPKPQDGPSEGGPEGGPVHYSFSEGGPAPYSPIEGGPARRSLGEGGFSLVELLVTMTLLTLIVLALMAVFSSTQQAFRSSVTQTDMLEGSRAAMDLMTRDLRGMTPSDGVSNVVFYPALNYSDHDAVNFFATNNSYPSLPYAPLVQPLPGTSLRRTNLLEYFFVLGRENTDWTGVGYVVNSGSSRPLYPLYRYYSHTNINVNPVVLYWNFLHLINYAQWTNLSHVMDGVVHLTVDAYNASGYQMTNTVQFYGENGGIRITNRNVWFSPPEWGQVGFAFYTNAVPAAVELELGVLEDRVLQRAESLGVPNQSPGPANAPAQWNYMQSQSGHLYLFHQRVSIPNVDPAAYQ